MIDFLKKLLLSNIYSLLILAIFSLVLGLVRGYNIILSFVILLALYLIIGIGVEMLLEKYFPQFADKKPSDKADDMPSEETRTKPRVSTASRSAQQEREPVRRPAAEPERTPQTERKLNTLNRTVRTEFPDRRSGVADHTAIRERAVRNSGVRQSSERTETKVTSSYIKSAGSIPRDMERKLVRTAADFNTIKRNSDRLSSGEQQLRRVYGTSGNPFVENPEELYTNKRPDTKPAEKPETLEIQADNSEADTAPVRSVIQSNNEIESSYQDDYRTASSDELDRISEDISREVTRRVSAPRTIRKTRVVLPDEFSDIDEPVRPKRSNIYSQPASDRSANIRNPKQDPVQSEERPQTARPGREREDDKVSADIEKINKLFNRGGAADDDDDDQNKTGLWGRFKKKR